MDLMNASIGVLLYERSRCRVERSFAFQCDDTELVETLTHEIEILETELNRRMGNPGGEG